MAWNGSGSAGGSAAPQAPKKKSSASSPVWQKGALAGVLVVAIGAAVLYMMRPEEKPVEKVRKAAKKETIASVTPAPAPLPQPEVVSVVTNRKGEVRPAPETYVDERGVKRFKNGNGRVPLPDAKKYLVKSYRRSTLPVFKHQVETEIATLLTLEPGDAVFADMPHGERFKRDFVNALLESIEILETDSEKDIQLKKEVEATKHELAARVKNGEDVGQILDQTRDELRRMATFKNQVMELVREQVVAENPGEEDISTYHEALNKMLEAKGIRPVEMTPLLRRKIGFDMRRKAKASEAKPE